MKNVLFINSAKKIDRSLRGLLKDLSDNNFFYFWLKDKVKPEEKIGEYGKAFFGPEAKGLVSSLFFFLLLPLFWLVYFFPLFSKKKNKKIVRVICTGINEKIIFTPLARLAKIGVVWLELPGEQRPKKIVSFFLKFFSHPAEIAVFTSGEAEALAQAGFDQKKISNISLGVNLSVEERQGDIFSNLAKADKPYSFYKNFTIGAVAGSGDRTRLELLLQAVKSCLNIIPNLRLVVIGTLAEVGNLNWLIKKMGLERRVWLVGEQKKMIEWFDDFDLYLSLAAEPGLGDLEVALLAASRGVPVAVFARRSFTDIIIDGETGFFIAEDKAESLAQKIIEIEADERRRLAIGAAGKRIVWQNFDRAKQLKRLEEIINR